MSREKYIPTGVGDVEEEATFAWVRDPLACTTGTMLTEDCSFMADKIMPLSQAEEGYDIFDKMKVQKVIFEAQK